ncbi:MAG: cyclic nucleotide-binding domain-containing protein [Kofleriaceae bacterium]
MNRRAYLYGAAMVLLTNFVAVALRAYAEAAFLSSYDKSQLPWLFVANAGGFAVATFGYDLVTRRAHTRIVDVVLLVALGIAAAIAPSLLRAGAAPVLLVVTLAAVSQVVGLGLWNRVAASVAGRDARRMLPRAGAAVTAGGMLAGLGAGALAITGDVLVYLGAAMTVIVIVLAIVQDRALVAGGAPGATAPAGTPEGLGAVQKRLLYALVGVALIEGVVTTVVDFQFLGAVKTRFVDDPTTPLLLFYGATNAFLLLLQVTAVPRLLVTRSLPTTVAIHPTFVVLGYLAYIAVPGLVTISGTRTADQVLRLATSRTAQEVSLSAFPPGPRARWKVLLRGALWPAGAAVGALLLLAVGPRDPRVIAGTAIGFAVVWWIAAQLAARRFQAALAAPLDIQTSRRTGDHSRIELATLEQWTQQAGDDDPKIAALARAALARARVDATDLGEHLRHDDPAVRAALFDQLARSPSPALLRELRAAIQIEDDDRALVLALKALAIAGDDAGLERGRSRAGLSRDVAAAVATSELALHGGDVTGELAALIARDPSWAIALIRARPPGDAALASVLARTANVAVIAAVGPAATLPILAAALATGSSDAVRAIAELDAAGNAHLAAQLPALSAVARLAIARALAGAPAATTAVAVLLADPDPEVAHAALRTALAVARGGGVLPAAPIAAAHAAALAALVAHLDARDAATRLTACAKHELELATRGCVARLMWASAVEVAAAGRDPAAIAATARRLIGGREPDRKRALDVLQELQAGRTEILAVIERWLRPPVPRTDLPDLAAHDPWLARLCAGGYAALEPTVVALRRPALFATVAGPALAALAERATSRSVDGELFAAAAAGTSMFVVTAGTLLAHREAAAPRRIELGGVVGELAVLTGAPRAATVTSDGPAEVLEIDREAFAAASRRAPELVLGLSATLAGWLAPNRPDVLG